MGYFWGFNFFYYIFLIINNFINDIFGVYQLFILDKKLIFVFLDYIFSLMIYYFHFIFYWDFIFNLQLFIWVYHLLFTIINFHIFYHLRLNFCRNNFPINIHFFKLIIYNFILFFSYNFHFFRSYYISYFLNFINNYYSLLLTDLIFCNRLFPIFHFFKLIFWKSLHLEVASGPFCLLVNSPWLLVFALVIILFIFTGFNIYCWTRIQFSYSNLIIFISFFFGIIFSFHFWSRDLLREFQKKYEILLIVLFLLFGGFLISEALLFISFFWASFHSLSSPTLGLWPGETFYIPDSCELTFSNTLLLSNAAVSLR